jgi:hypothetical protein
LFNLSINPISGKSKKARKLELLVNEETYIASGRARKLPIYKCLISKNWQETGTAQIIVMRQHVNNNVTVGCYLVDTLCIGMKESYYFFNIPEDNFLEVIEENNSEFSIQLESCSYELAHNIIYGSVEFAEEYGISPDRDFKVTQMILEEDDERVPLMDIDFGKDGEPLLVADSNDPRTDYYLKQLSKYAGEGNYDFIDISDDDDGEDEEDYEDFFANPQLWETEDWNVFIENTKTDKSLIAFMDVVEYIYQKAEIIPEAAVKVLTAEGTGVVSMKITFDPIENQKYRSTAEEREEAEEVYFLMNDEFESDNLLILAERTRKNIAKWPDNPVFYNYLYNIYQLVGNPHKAREVALLLTKNFPDYLFGKLNYANELINQGKIDKVPELFKGEFNLKSIYPERDTFHINELVSFNTVMCLYFLEKGDVYTANIYRNMLFEIEIPEHIPLNEGVFFRLDMAICEIVQKILQDAKKDDQKKQDLIQLIMD